jgi:hypothetical protein
MKVLDVIILLLLLSPLAIADVENLQNIDLPIGAKTSWVATDMTHNGQGMAIKAINSKQTVSEVIDFYRNSWHQDGDIPGYVENKIADWHVISKISQSHNLVVQVKSGERGTTQGFISSMSLQGAQSNYEESIPKPPNSATVSHTKTGDKGKTGYTTILVSPSSIGAAIGFYRDQLGRDGWSLVSDEYLESSHVLKFNRQVSAYEVVVSAAEDGTTVILLNRTQSNG